MITSLIQIYREMNKKNSVEIYVQHVVWQIKIITISVKFYKKINVKSTEVESWKAEDKVAVLAKEIRRNPSFYPTHEKRKTITKQIYVTVAELDHEVIFHKASLLRGCATYMVLVFQR